MTRIGRFSAAVGAAAALTAGLAACAASVAKQDVESSIKAELDKQVPGAGPVTCPSELKAEVGQSVRCEFEVDGQQVDAVAKITSLQGDKANYDITTEARPVKQALLERKLGEQIGKQTGVTIDSTACSGDLQPTVGSAADCTVTGGGESLAVTVTVTSVEGGLINYSIEQA